MKQMCMVLGFIGLVLPATAVFAADTPAGQPQYDIQTGDDLHRACANPAGATVTAAEHDRLLVCGAYIRGYLGYYSVSRNLTQGKGFCLPDGGVAAEKLRLLYIGVLDKKPEIRDYPAAVDLASILQAAYPCQATPPAKKP
jgi:hypothetical protein